MGGIHPRDIADYRAMYKRIQDGETKSESVVRFYNRRKHKFEWTQMITTGGESEVETADCSWLFSKCRYAEGS